jgi:YidC/Oxa1 family membrane protein insertase
VPPVVFANVLQPLVDFFEGILKFFHDTVGFGWGLSIIVMTLVVRACLLPLTLKQFHGMQRLAKVQPEIKRLQEKYKHDRERLNQEMMRFYRENKVNPFASCLPLVAQLPVFFSLFYMLRKDLRYDICPEVQAQLPHGANPVPCGPGGDAGFLFIPDLTDKAHGAVLDDDGSQPEDDHAGAAVRLRDLRHPVPCRPARLLDHHQPVDDRAAGHRAKASRSSPSS